MFENPTWASALKIAWPRLPYNSKFAITQLANKALEERAELEAARKQERKRGEHDELDALRGRVTQLEGQVGRHGGEREGAGRDAER